MTPKWLYLIPAACVYCTLFQSSFFPPPQLSNHIFSQCFCLALGVLIGGYGPEVALWGLLFRNNGLYEFLSCFSPPSSLQIKDPDSQSITGLNSLLGYISSLFFILYCRLKWKSLPLRETYQGQNDLWNYPLLLRRYHAISSVRFKSLRGPWWVEKNIWIDSWI